MHNCRRFSISFGLSFLLPLLLFSQGNTGQTQVPVVLSQQHTLSGAFHSAPTLTIDKAGGAFVLFKSRRGNHAHVNLYLQHINDKGRPLLAANGVPVCPQPANQAHAKMQFNSEVGLYVAWEEKRDNACNDIFLQLVNDRGEPLWSPEGVRVSVSLRDKSNLQILRDGNDGLYVFWEEEDPLLKTRRIFGQRISPTGERLWYDTGRPMLSPKGRQQGVQPAWAPGSSFILLWEDFRDSPSGELYVQKFDSTGREVWAKGGRALRRADIVRQRHPVVYGDGFGGVLCAYEGVRESGDQAILLLRVTRHGSLKYHKLVTLTTDDQNSPQIYQKGSRAVVVWQDQSDASTAHRLQMFNLRTGERIWRVTGYPISVGNSKQLDPKLVISSIYGNLVLSWLEDTPTGQELFTQKIGKEMDKQWKATDIRLSERGEDLFDFSLVEDERGGAWYVWSVIAGEGTRLMYQGVDSYGELKFREPRALLKSKRGDEQLKINQVMTAEAPDGSAYIAWEDSRNGEDNHDIFVQRLSPDGTVDWQSGGIAVATAMGNQSVPKLLATNQGVLVGWNDRRNGRDENLYIQYLDNDGTSKWPSGGQALCLARKSQSSLKFTPSLGDTSFAIWTDSRNLYSTGFDLYMQKIEPNGKGSWVAGGSPLTSAKGYQTAAQILARKDGGFVATWMDERDGHYNIYLAGRNNQGRKLPNAIDGAVAGGAFHQRYPKLLQLDNGSIALAWEDDRFGMQQTRIHYQEFSSNLRRLTGINREYMPSLPGNNGRQSGIQMLHHPVKGVMAVWLEKVGEHNHLAYAHINNGVVRTPIDLIAGLEDFQRVELAVAKGRLYAVWEGTEGGNAETGKSVLYMARMDINHPQKCSREYAVPPMGNQREPQLLRLKNGALGMVYSETADNGDDVLKLKWLVR